eukprot:gene13836-16313_t
MDTTSVFSEYFDKTDLKVEPLPFDEEMFDHKVIVDDLVVTFPMDVKEIARELDARKRYKVALTIPPLPKVEIGRGVTPKSMAERLQEHLVNNGETMTEFEIQQANKVGGYYVQDTKPRSTMNIEHAAPFGAHKEFINTMKRLNTLDNPRQIMYRDRQGAIFTTFREFLRRIPDPTSIRQGFTTYSAKGYDISYYTTLGKYLANGRLDIVALMVRPGGLLLHECSGTCDRVTPFPPNGEYYGHTSTMTPYRYSIPSLVKICFGVLREQFLIDKQLVLKSLQRLTVALVIDFCRYCLEDQKPGGYDIVEYLLENLKGTHLDASFQDMVPFGSLVTALFSQTNWVYDQIVRRHPQNLFHIPYECRCAISVYSNLHMFTLHSVPEPYILIPATSTVTTEKIGTPSIVDKATFEANFTSNTGSLFATLPWTNMVVTGGLITKSLTGWEDIGYSQSDIDIKFYGLENQAAILERYHQLYNAIPGDKSKFTVVQIGDTLSILRRNERHINICMENYKTLDHLLLCQPIDCANFAYDGTQLWTTIRGVNAMNYRCNFATAYGQRHCGDYVYQIRLINYTNRGFSITYVPNETIIASSLSDYPKSQYQSGIALLFAARDSPKVHDKLMARTIRKTLPAEGEEITKETFEYDVEDFYYNGIMGGQVTEAEKVQYFRAEKANTAAPCQWDCFLFHKQQVKDNKRKLLGRQLDDW